MQKSSGLTRMNIHSLPKRQSFREIRWCCVYSGISAALLNFEFLICNQTLNIDLYSQQLQWVHENILRKDAACVNRVNFVLQYDNARPHSARSSQEKKYWIRLVCSTLSNIFARPCTRWFPSFSLSTKWSKWQKIFSRRSDENVCRTLPELETIWILFERNQQATW